MYWLTGMRLSSSAYVPSGNPDSQECRYCVFCCSGLSQLIMAIGWPPHSLPNVLAIERPVDYLGHVGIRRNDKRAGQTFISSFVLRFFCRRTPSTNLPAALDSWSLLGIQRFQQHSVHILCSELWAAGRSLGKGSFQRHWFQTAFPTFWAVSLERCLVSVAPADQRGWGDDVFPPTIRSCNASHTL